MKTTDRLGLLGELARRRVFATGEGRGVV
jgi:hypothetical protein